MADRKDFQLGLGKLAKAGGTSETMKAFTAVHEAALADGELPRKVKELIATAISITSQCEGCIGWHVDGALRAGASAAEVEEAIGVAILMGGGPATYYGSKALEALQNS
ncbi:carboxymuconolactone decarboxylase family protein [Cryptosporangium phraense]|uniref:Carboxymuconolactone decarboxylase family protein n=1 Tax=Cryptosporangium phraense TaxID=2593070 RepID=A0A545AXV3_9ACTN|nr:carboxymuconolactone decarboxylase family protein [Cryptosporangium phraense]TQS46166.1 carboxymuconolactone decarboxylase family protein [Cryptosporangium phraense]